MAVKELFPELRNWRLLLRWLWEPRPLWMGLLVVVAIGMWVCLFGTERAVQVAGGGLQLLGVLVVIHGLYATHIFFGRPGLIDLIGEWLLRYPFRSPEDILGHASGTIGYGGRGYGHTTFKAPADAGPEARIEAVEKNIESLQKYTSALHKMLDDNAAEASAKVKQESAEREQQNQAVLHKLERFATNGIAISAVGPSGCCWVWC